MAALDFPNAPSIGNTYTGPNGAVYTWDGAAWTVSGVLSTGTAAGGDLTGTYPNPTIGAGKVTWAQRGDATYARVTRNATAQSIPSAANTIVTFDTALTNAGGMWASPNQFNIVNAGYYLMGGSLQFASSAGGARRIAYIFVSNGAWAASEAPQGTLRILSVTTGGYLPAAAYVWLIAYQDSGAALNIDLTVPPTFWIARVGP